MDVIQDRKSDGSGSSVVNYINGPGIDNKLKQTTGSTTSYFLTDHLGSTVGLADQAGSITSQTSYDSFGNATSQLPTRYGYTGREADEYTGLMYYRARFYDPQIGRFISEDPIGFNGGDINLYGYVWNNPQSFVDPSGLDGMPLPQRRRPRRGRGIRRAPRGIVEPPPPTEPPQGEDPPPIIDPPPPTPTPTPTPSPIPTPSYPPPTPPTSSGECDCETAIPRMPDFYTGSVNFPLPFPILRSIPQIGSSLSLTIDRNYHIYVAPGIGAGGPKFWPGWSATAGWMITRCKPEEGQLQGFLTGKSYSGGGFIPLGNPLIGAGGYGTRSPGNGTAINFGVGSPGFSMGASYGFQIW
jgi:RHS repeat-associated protein